MADVRSQIRCNNNSAVDWAILSKFGVEIDLDIAKRVLSLKPKPQVDFQLHSRKFEKLKKKSIWRHNFAVTSPVWMKFGKEMINHIEKQQILLYKNLAVYNAF